MLVAVGSFSFDKSIHPYSDEYIGLQRVLTVPSTALEAGRGVHMMVSLPHVTVPTPAAGSPTKASGLESAIDKIGGFDSLGTMLKELS